MAVHLIPRYQGHLWSVQWYEFYLHTLLFLKLIQTGPHIYSSTILNLKKTNYSDFNKFGMNIGHVIDLQELPRVFNQRGNIFSLLKPWRKKLLVSTKDKVMANCFIYALKTNCTNTQVWFNKILAFCTIFFSSLQSNIYLTIKQVFSM